MWIYVFACITAAHIGLLVALSSSGSGSTATAHYSPSTDTDEYDLKAAFLFKFARYTKWPKGAFKDAKTPLVIGVVGDDPFGKKLEKAFKGKKIDGRSVVIRRYSCAKDMDAVNVLVLCDLDAKECKRCLAKVSRKPVLTIADTGGVKASGAMIGFYLTRKRIGFEIAPSRVKEADLKMKSLLFKAAKIVRTKE